MSEITKNVRKVLDSFETSELERVLKTVEDAEYYRSGLKMISGGFATATAYELDEDYDDELGMEVDVILIKIEAGVAGESKGESIVALPKIVLSKNMTLREKIESINTY
jgi:hypothetical protein